MEIDFGKEANLKKRKAINIEV